MLVNEGCGRGRVGSALSIGSSRGSVPVQLVRQSGSRLVTTVGAVGWGHCCLGCLLRSDQLGEGSDWLGGLDSVGGQWIDCPVLWEAVLARLPQIVIDTAANLPKFWCRLWRTQSITYLSVCALD